LLDRRCRILPTIPGAIFDDRHGNSRSALGGLESGNDSFKLGTFFRSDLAGLGDCGSGEVGDEKDREKIVDMALTARVARSWLRLPFIIGDPT
jgi:hypothetical protein